MQTKQLSTVHKVTISALVLSGVAVVIQKIMGVTNYPLIPPAIIIALIAASCLYFAPWKRWSAIIAWLIPTSLIVGPVVDKWYENLWRPEVTGFAGIWLQWVSIVVAFVGASIVLYRVFHKKK